MFICFPYGWSKGTWKRKEVDCGFELSCIKVPTAVLHEKGGVFQSLVNLIGAESTKYDGRELKNKLPSSKRAIMTAESGDF